MRVKLQMHILGFCLRYVDALWWCKIFLVLQGKLTHICDRAGKGGDDAEQEVATGKCDLKMATGINIMKSGNDPELGPNEAYPDWLWKLAEPAPNLAELQQKGWENIEDLAEVRTPVVPNKEIRVFLHKRQ